MTIFSIKKLSYKRNAFGNHSKGIINLNLKLNYEKIFRFLKPYILFPLTDNMIVFLKEINKKFLSLFGGAKVRTIYQLQKIFIKINL